MPDQIANILTPAQVAQQQLQSAKEGYIHRVAVAFDQFCNVTFNGLPDETISARGQRDAVKGDILAKVLVHGLDAIQANHGQKAEAGDLQRAQTVAAVETKALNE